MTPCHSDDKELYACGLLCSETIYDTFKGCNSAIQGALSPRPNVWVLGSLLQGLWISHFCPLLVGRPALLTTEWFSQNGIQEIYKPPLDDSFAVYHEWVYTSNNFVSRSWILLISTWFRKMGLSQHCFISSERSRCAFGDQLLNNYKIIIGNTNWAPTMHGTLF